MTDQKNRRFPLWQPAPFTIGILSFLFSLLACYFLDCLLQDWDRWHTPFYWLGMVGAFMGFWGYFWDEMLDQYYPRHTCEEYHGD